MADLDAQAVRALTLATRTAVAILGPGDPAREVAQDVAIRVLERRTQLRDPEKFDAWVHRIAVRETLRVRARTGDGRVVVQSREYRVCARERR